MKVTASAVQVRSAPVAHFAWQRDPAHVNYFISTGEVILLTPALTLMD